MGTHNTILIKSPAMKHIMILLLCLISFAACNSVKQKPSGLMVEFIRDPVHVYILDSRPELTWIVPEDIRQQSAFQVLVSTSKENLERGDADVWDSGKINDHNSAEQEYKGPALSDNATYYWKVRVWGDPADKPSPFSDVQSFRTGILRGYLTTPNRIESFRIKPEQLVEKTSGHYFIDFGRDAFGKLELEISSKTSDTIIIHLGEKLSAENQIDANPEGTIRYSRVLLPVHSGTGKYTVKPVPDRRNTGGAAIRLPDSMGVIMPFRYCEIEGLSTGINLIGVWQKAYYHYFDDEASFFTSSDTILNQIWDLCKYSIKATTFAGLYIDGDRERIPYEADAYINQLGHYSTDREYAMARRTNEYFMANPTWPTEWILHTVPMFYADFIYTGNHESMAFYYEALKHKTLIALAREDGLITAENATDEIMKSLGFTNPNTVLRDIVDWPPAQKDTGWKLATPEGERDGYEMVEINTVVNSFYYNSLLQMAGLAGYLGEKKDSAFFQGKADKVKTSINDLLLDRGRGIYFDGENSDHSSLHANMLPLAFGLVPEEYISSVVEFIKTRGMACSVYGAQYLLDGLYLAGESEYAFQLLTSTGDRSWYNMIRSGSTITMEAWDMKYKPNSDWNHAWGAVPANMIPRGLWGIQPTGPGFSRARIKPQLGGLKNCKIRVPTIRGFIEAEYQSEDNRQEYSIYIPSNMYCEFIIPPEYGNLSVTHNRTGIVKTEDPLLLQTGINIITIE
jgi:hypothetical protein